MTLPAHILRKLLPYLSTFVSFNAIQAAQLLLPMLVLPWLARVLGPEAYGLCLYMGVISGIVTLVMDWGFPFGGTKDVAMNRGREEALGNILADALSAKTLLAACCFFACLLLSPFVPHAPDYPGAYVLAILAGISRGISPTWFFQGLGQGMRRVAAWDTASSALVVLLVVVWVREAADWPVYLLLLVIVKGGSYSLLTARQLGRYPHTAFSPRRGWEALARHKTLFAGNMSALVCGRGTQLILGYFLSPSQMGMLVTADKIVRAAVSVNYPLMQTMFPEICIMRRAEGERTTRLLRLTLLGTAVAMTCGASALWFAAPWLADVVLGSAYTAVPPVLRAMSFFIPVQACNDVLAGQILSPLGHARTQTLVKAAVAILSLPATALLGYFYGLAGGACLPPLLQGCVLLGLIWSVLRYCPGIFSPGGSSANALRK
ncbi:MAG: lipopolysaccharide biosynthesis protein [Desulfovibrio sp.]|jgi:PST family polysaccharide transporter|nr:lipopolysaccharide biosynthesis protein [Desulfovibrio sp.]